MKIMETRLDVLKCLDEGYRDTGMYFVPKCGGELSNLAADDYGSGYFIIFLKTLLDIELNTAINAFYYGLIGVSFVIGLLAIPGYFSAFRARAIAFAGYFLLLGVLLLLFKGLYLVAAGVAIALIPWALNFHRRGKIDLVFMVFCFATGAVIAAAHWVRVHSATAVGIFLTFVIIYGFRVTWFQRGMALAVLLAGLVAVNIPFNQAIQQSEAYLEKNMSQGHTPYFGHPFWHSIYLGLGYISNDLGISYRDKVAFARVEALAPGTIRNSPEYEAILRNETLRLLAANPGHAINLFSAKLGVIAVYLLVFANIGLIAAFLRPKEKALEAAFWCALAFSALQGLLVIPRVSYLSGFIAFAALYGIISLGHALEQATPKELWNEMRTRFKRA